MLHGVAGLSSSSSVNTLVHQTLYKDDAYEHVSLEPEDEPLARLGRGVPLSRVRVVEDDVERGVGGVRDVGVG